MIGAHWFTEREDHVGDNAAIHARAFDPHVRHVPLEQRPIRTHGLPIRWTRAHREQLWQLIESGRRGVASGDLISKKHRRDLARAGYVRYTLDGRHVATDHALAGLRDGLLSDGAMWRPDGTTFCPLPPIGAAREMDFLSEYARRYGWSR